MKSSDNTVNWFEIPASDLSRAKEFYETIFEIKMEVVTMMGMDMAFFPNDHNNSQVSGALVKSEHHVPSRKGAKIYLNANPDLSNVLLKIEKAGGKILVNKMLIDENTGYMAFFQDTEGNEVGLHSDT